MRSVISCSTIQKLQLHLQYFENYQKDNTNKEICMRHNSCNRYFYNNSVSNEKRGRRRHEPTENYHQHLQLPSALWSFIVSFSALFSCPATTLLLRFTLMALIASFCATAGSCFQLEFIETENRAKRKTILDLHSSHGHKHVSK